MFTVQILDAAEMTLSRRASNPRWMPWRERGRVGTKRCDGKRAGIPRHELLESWKEAGVGDVSVESSNGPWSAMSDVSLGLGVGEREERGFARLAGLPLARHFGR